MNYEKVIVMPVWKRADYTQTVLEGLRSCDGIDDYRIFIFVEPGYQDVLDTVYRFEGLNKNVITNDIVMGATPNTFKCMERGFFESDFVIYFEDDDVPNADCLKYFEWARDKYENDAEILTVTSYSRDGVPGCDPYAVSREKWFHPWGWATWRDRWDEIKAKWDNALGWDTIINHHVRGDRCEIRPRLARTQNIGATRSVNVPSPEWHRANHFNSMWVGSWSEKPLQAGEYHE